MANWDNLLGLPLEAALSKMRERGIEPRVVITRAPRREEKEGGTLRVIRVREDEVTVSVFYDGDPAIE
ncbi:MAG: hypothetical protein IJ438_13315 [Clostridia bacterium]|nr:hypothetical protein [Clostridia bacterium]